MTNNTNSRNSFPGKTERSNQNPVARGGVEILHAELAPDDQFK